MGMRNWMKRREVLVWAARGFIAAVGSSLVSSAARAQFWGPAFWRKRKVFGPFPGGNQSYGSVLDFARELSKYSDSGGPQAGGTLTLNNQALGSYDYVIREGNQTVSSFVNSAWFTDTEDSRSAWVIVRGNLTIAPGQVFRPARRKLFTVIYVTGDLVVNGEISMSQRGANHSPTGSNIAAAEIRIANGTYSGVVNPKVPAMGAAGGPARTYSGSGTSSQVGASGSNGTDGATGGGGGGALRKFGSKSATVSSGAGAAGSPFSGGPGGGGVHRETSGSAGSGAANGGRGGNGNVTTSSGDLAAGGGAGNPGGSGAKFGTGSAAAGGNGTGGVLIIIVEGNYSGSGAVTASGASGGNGSGGGGHDCGGGGSGGGSVTIMIKGVDNGPVPTALGGSGGNASHKGGAGGNGTARKLALS